MNNSQDSKYDLRLDFEVTGIDIDSHDANPDPDPSTSSAEIQRASELKAIKEQNKRYNTVAALANFIKREADKNITVRWRTRTRNLDQMSRIPSRRRSPAGISRSQSKRRSWRSWQTRFLITDRAWDVAVELVDRGCQSKLQGKSAGKRLKSGSRDWI